MSSRDTRSWGLTALFVGSWCLGLHFFRHVRSWSWAPDQLGAHDWDAIAFFLEAVTKPIREHGQFAFWNPYYVSGLPIFANPQTKLFCPTFFLALFMDTASALKVATLLYGLVGFPVMAYLLGVVLRLRPEAAFFGVVLFCSSSFFVLHLYAGHANFVAAPLLPLALAFAIRADEIARARAAGVQGLFAQVLAMLRLRSVWAHCGGAALVLYTVVAEGGVHLVLFFVTVGGLFAMIAAIRERALRSVVVPAIVAGLFGVFVLHRAAPAAAFLSEHGRYFRAEATAIGPDQLFAMFTAVLREPAARLSPDWAYLWWEYGNYVGVGGLLVFGGLLAMARRMDWPIAGILLLTVLLCMGPFSAWSPARIFSFVPLLKNQTVHSRWGLVVVFLMAAWGAVLLDRLLQRSSRWIRGGPLVRVLAVCLTLVLYADLQRASASIVGRYFPLKLPPVAALPSDSFIETISSLPSYGAASAMWPAIRSNRSTREGYELLNSPNRAVASDHPKYAGEFYLMTARKRIRPDSWSPDRLVFSFGLAEPDRLIINQNYFPGWQADAGRVVASDDGRLAVDVPAGRTRVKLSFSDPLAFWLSVLSLGSMAVWILLMVFGRFSQERTPRTVGPGN